MTRRLEVTIVAAWVARAFIAASVSSVSSVSYAQSYVPETTSDYLNWCVGAGWFARDPKGLSCALVIGNSAGLLATLGSGSACMALRRQLGDLSEASLERYGAAIGNQVFDWIQTNIRTLKNQVVADTAAAISALSGCR